jgi:hypothetical protein
MVRASICSRHFLHILHVVSESMLHKYVVHLVSVSISGAFQVHSLLLGKVLHDIKNKQGQTGSPCLIPLFSEMELLDPLCSVVIFICLYEFTWLTILSLGVIIFSNHL